MPFSNIASTLSELRSALRDRIVLNSVLIVLCFVSVLTLESQSAASYASYLLALSMVLTFRLWNDVFNDWFSWLVLVLLAYLGLSSIWSPGVGLSEVFSHLVRVLLVFTFVVAFAECLLRGQLQRWLGRALAIAGSAAACAAIVVYFVTQPADGRLNGLGQLDTHVIAALVFGVTMVLVIDSALRESSGGWRLFYGFASLSILLAVALSDSRNAWVSLLAGSIAFLLAHVSRSSSELLVSIVVCAFTGVLVGMALLANEPAAAFLLPRGDSFRLIIWQGSLERVLSGGWLFGLGIAASDDLQVGEILFKHPHNMYLSVLHQGGVVGLLLFVAVIVVALRTLFQNIAEREAKLAIGVLVLALASYLLDGHELLDKVGETWFLFWLPVAIAVGLRWKKALGAVIEPALGRD